MMGRRGVVWKTPTVTADGLKIFACVVMLIQNIGLVIVENGLIDISRYTQATLASAMEVDSRLMMLAGISSVMQLIGGLAVPIFAFLLVEGFLHTSDYKKYLYTILLFALLAEIPYDFAVKQRLCDFSSQNALVTMAICLVMLKCLSLVKEKLVSFAAAAGEICIMLGALAWVTVFRAQYGLCMVLLTAIFYLFYSRHVWKTVLGLLVSLLYVTGPLSFYGIWCYNEERKDKLPKYAYYIFYPLHLLVLGIIARFLV